MCAILPQRCTIVCIDLQFCVQYFKKTLNQCCSETIAHIMLYCTIAIYCGGRCCIVWGVEVEQRAVSNRRREQILAVKATYIGQEKITIIIIVVVDGVAAVVFVVAFVVAFVVVVFVVVVTTKGTNIASQGYIHWQEKTIIIIIA